MHQTNLTTRQSSRRDGDETYSSATSRKMLAVDFSEYSR